MAELEASVTADSIHHRILMRLCRAPKATRGMSAAMLEREFKSPKAIEELAKADLIEGRDWHETLDKVPTPIWVPTRKGEELCAKLCGGRSEE